MVVRFGCSGRELLVLVVGVQLEVVAVVAAVAAGVAARAEARAPARLA